MHWDIPDEDQAAFFRLALKTDPVRDSTMTSRLKKVRK